MSKVRYILVLIPLFLSFNGFCNIITFDDQGHIDGQSQGNPYSIVNNGETFEFIVSNGSNPIVTNHVYRETESNCGNSGLGHLSPGSAAATTWTIRVVSGNEIDLGQITFSNIWTCFPTFSYDLEIEGFKDGISTGSPQLFNSSAIGQIFTPNSNFDDVDEIVITCTSAGGLTELGMDDIVWNSNSIPRPEIDVSGNGVSIINNDTTPDILDGTDYTSQCQRFTITNLGTTDLNLSDTSDFVIIESGSSDFSITLQPGLSMISAGASTTFVIEFNPTSAGTKTAIIAIPNDDCDEGTFRFRVEGGTQVNSGMCASPEIDVIGNGQVIENGDTIPKTSNNTDFGAVVSTVEKEFIIDNSNGIGELTLTGTPYVVLGSGSGTGFSISKQPDNGVIPQGGSEVFLITYEFSDKLTQDATVIIANDDDNESTYSFRIHVNKYNIIVHNFMSPNGDGENDTFFIENITENNHQVTVIDQSGTIVFESSNYQNDWTAEELQNGTYFYIVQILDTGEVFRGGLLVNR